MKKLPIVAIVGRANVGKSSLFNAVLNRREAIVAREPGTTRDSITAKASFFLSEKRISDAREPISEAGLRKSETGNRKSGLHEFWLVDTAGMKTPEDDFELTIQEQIKEAAASADIIWVVIEATVPITDEDRRVATMALKSRKPVFLVVNKADRLPQSSRHIRPRRSNPQPQTSHYNTILNGRYEYYQKLGIKPIFLTSATQQQGIHELLKALLTGIPKATQDDAPDRLHVAILGRPNVGKSSLFNSLARKQQAIVADKAGTTRDINRIVVRYQGREIELMDTAGIRRSGKIGQGIERFSVIRALSAVEQADVCVLLMDANELHVTLDQKIAGLVKEAGKGLVLVVSKWDSVEKDAYTRDQLAPQIAASYDFVPWAPLIFTSSRTGQNIARLFDLILDIDQARHTRIKTTNLNRWLRESLDKHPPAGLKNRQPKLNYMVQEEDNPTNFKIYGAHGRFLHWSYKRYLERELRQTFGFEGTPIRFWFFDKNINRH